MAALILLSMLSLVAILAAAPHGTITVLTVIVALGICWHFACKWLTRARLEET
jgi:hypothetical protein